MSIFAHKENNFDLVRLLAAIVVIESHSYAICAKQGWLEPISGLTGVTHSGELSVVVFFFLSGAFITKSLINSPSLGDFLTKRICRIYPALVVSCILNSLLIAPIFSNANILDIAKEHETWRYIIRNSIGVWNEYFIPGLYENHPNKGLNGSLWSITLELRLYLAWAIAGMFLLFKNQKVALYTLSTALLALFIVPERVPLIGNNNHFFGQPDFLRFSVIFILGALAYLIDLKRSALYYLTLFSLSLLFLLWPDEFRLYGVFSVAIALSVLFGTSKFARSVKLPGDYSYGVYLYGWPAQQVVYALFPSWNPLLNAVLSILIALVLAVLSWHFIEHPCLGYAKRNNIFKHVETVVVLIRTKVLRINSTAGKV